MRKEQLLLLALLAALFRPTSSQDHFEDDEIDDDCHVKTAIVLKKLDNCDSEKIKDDFRRKQWWTDVVKETFGAMMMQQQEEIKSLSDQLTKKLVNKMEDLMMQVLPVKERDCHKILASWSFGNRDVTLFFKTMGRTFYYSFSQWGTWNENCDWCSSRGMQLATLKTAEEVKQVENILRTKISIYDKVFWVSASDIGRSPGQFHWAEGTPMLKSTWYSGHPKEFKANQETCAYIRTGFEKLIDSNCLDKLYILCEVPELLATCI